MLGAGMSAMRFLGIGMLTTSVGLAEIYCPYPVMAQLAAQALNLQTDDPRGWTITGAHMSHGAPGAGCEWPPRLDPRSSGLAVSFVDGCCTCGLSD